MGGLRQAQRGSGLTVKGGIVLTNRAHTDQSAINKAISAIRDSKEAGSGKLTLAAFTIRKLDVAPIPISIALDPRNESNTRAICDPRGRVVQVNITIGVLGFKGELAKYKSGAIRRLDTVLIHELAHAYGLVYEAGVGLSQERAINVENSYRAAMKYELRDENEDD